MTAVSLEESRVLDPAGPCRAHLRGGGVSVLLDLSDHQLPSIVHWGGELPELGSEEAAVLALAAVPHLSANSLDVPLRPDMLGSPHTGWTGRPGLAGDRNGAAWTPKFHVTQVELAPAAGEAAETDGSLTSAGPATLTVTAVDTGSGLDLVIELELAASGLLRARARLTNRAEGDYRVQELGVILPLPSHAREILDFAGHWGAERAPQRGPLPVGIHLREGRRGRTGADAVYVLSAGEPGFGFADGQVWGLHVGFSGNHRAWAERLSNGLQVLGGSELLLPGEVVLGAGESYSTPWLYGVWGKGLDDQAARLHAWLRARPKHPSRPRPVTLNVWEAVYFDHRLDRLTELADRAAEVGVERFVLDDGWFGSRRNDSSGLGDWVVSADVWPEGLDPLISHVHSLGMEFGLWFEPEMVNPDSDVARAHPEWIMAPAGRLPVSSRNQQILNIGLPGAYGHVRDQMVALLERYPIAYIKWDHNRDLVEAGTQPDGRPGVHAQTLAAYRLMAELKERFPGLEIESCSSGGSRVDLGVLEHTDRVWTSDSIDPLDRQRMHRWTQQLIPPELMGSHIASQRSHTTGRMHSLHFRAGTAVWGHLGIEWDLTEATREDARELADWVQFYKEHRALLHGGRMIRLDSFDPSLQIHGVVDASESRALFAVVRTAVSDIEPLGRFTLRGLDPKRSYRLRDVTPGPTPQGFRPPPWWPDGDGAVLTGRALEAVGVHVPGLLPDELRILRLDALVPDPVQG
jgi:alpha-galactosidase